MRRANMPVGAINLREHHMAKGQKRSNKEIKKPKQEKKAAPAVAGFANASATPVGAKKK